MNVGDILRLTYSENEVDGNPVKIVWVVGLAPGTMDVQPLDSLDPYDCWTVFNGDCHVERLGHVFDLMESLAIGQPTPQYDAPDWDENEEPF